MYPREYHRSLNIVNSLLISMYDSENEVKIKTEINNRWRYCPEIPMYDQNRVLSLCCHGDRGVQSGKCRESLSRFHTRQQWTLYSINRTAIEMSLPCISCPYLLPLSTHPYITTNRNDHILATITFSFLRVSFKAHAVSLPFS